LRQFHGDAGIPMYGFHGNGKTKEDRTKTSCGSGKSLRILVVEDHGDTLQASSPAKFCESEAYSVALRSIEAAGSSPAMQNTELTPIL
jgi:hypothetical protein